VDTSHREAVAGCIAPALAAGLALPGALRAGELGWSCVALVAVGAALRLRLPGVLGVVGAVLALGVGSVASIAHLRALARDPLASRIDRQVQGQAVVTGTVVHGQWDQRAIASFEGTDVLLHVGIDIETGDVVTVEGHLRAPKGPTADGFDERTWLARQGVHELLRAGSAEVVGRRGGVWGLVDDVRRNARDGLRAGGGDGEAVADGVLLGGNDGLTPETRDAFRSSGLGHLLAVSGQNVVLLVAAILIVCGWIGVARAPAIGLAIASTVLYVLVVGPGASVVRAGVTGVVVAVAWLANRPVARWHVLAVAAAACLWLDPWATLEPGFQLSFTAVVAIFLLAPRLLAWLEGTSCPARLREPLAVSAACTLATAPIAFLQFDRVAIAGSLPANLAALPAVAPLLWVGVVAALVHPLSPALAYPLALAASALGDYLVAVAHAGAWIDRVADRAPVVELAGLAVALAIAYRRLTFRRWLVCLSVGASLAIAQTMLARGPAGYAAPVGQLRVVFLDVGQGNATLVQANGFDALVDAGPPGSQVVAKLRGYGVHRLDALVLSHPQADHVGDAADVIDGMPVDRVLDPGLASDEQYEVAALAAARRRGVPVVLARRGVVLQTGTFDLRVLGPRQVEPGEDPNAAAAVLVAEQGGCRVLLPADAEANVTLPLDPPRVAILEVAHHGSDDPDLPALLRRVRPWAAVISVGADNPYGHPAASTLAALAAAHVPVERTDLRGDVVELCQGQSRP
jgi:competence protein ComEC